MSIRIGSGSTMQQKDEKQMS